MTGGPTEPVERRVEPHAWGEGSDFWGPRHDYRESLMLRILRRRSSGGTVLNAGCGAGSMTERMLGEGREVTSIDASGPFVERLAERLRATHPEAPVLVGDLQALPFEDARFDAVVCGEVLEHLPDDRVAAGELTRVLAPGGVLVASVPANPWRYDWVDHWAGHRRRYTAGGLVDLLEGAGLERVEVTAWGFPLTGLYHRTIYERMLRRRIEAGGAEGMQPSAASRILARIARMAFELDTLFLGRRPGYLGFLAAARRPDGGADEIPR